MSNWRVQIRHKTSAAWIANNPVLLVGEQGFETDTNLFKIGDGVHSWNSLAYSPDYVLMSNKALAFAIALG